MTEPQRSAVALYSEGTRLAAEVFTPAGGGPPSGHPAILLCHGWGGLMSQLSAYGEKFARAGFVAMTFDYRGWGESDGRIIPLRDGPRLLEAGETTMAVRVLREIVDPIDQTTDIKNCLNYLWSQPGVDKTRLGVWGTSFGGGHSVFTAGTDDRIKAAVAQIGGLNFPPDRREWARGRGADKARGEIEPVVPQNGQDGMEGLKGTPDVARMAEHSPLAAAARIHVPTLIIDAEFEELVNRLEHGFTAHMMIRQNAPSEYHTFPCKHYAVYDQFFEQSTDLALDWFRRYL